MATVDPKDSIIEFLQKDYELKISYLTAHLTRMWQRFNFFIALESALSVALFGFFKGNEGLSHYATLIAMIGAISSICWYIFGAQDRCLASLYRKHVKDAGEKTAYTLGLEEDYVHAASQTIKIGQKWYKYIYQWRSEHISTTKLAALFPLLAILY